MKKLVVLMLVFGVVSVAGAAEISLEGQGAPLLATPGTTVTINILTDTALIGLDALVTVTGGDVITGAMSPADAADYGWDPVSFPIDPLGLGTATVEVGGATFAAAPGPAVGYVDIAYTGGIQIVSLSAGTLFGGTYDVNYNPAGFSQGVVAIVPEPMTLGLLGLGGLFLRRRKK